MTVHLRRLGTLGGSLIIAAGVLVAPVQAAEALLGLPAPTGGHRVGTTSVHLVDHSRPDPLAPSPRARELMVRLWYPAMPSRQPVAPYQTLAVSGFYTAFLNATSGTSFPDDLLAFPTHSRENAPVAGSRHPVVVFAPDSAGNGVDGTGLHEELASRGYVVVGIDHTFDAGAVEFPGGRIETRKPDLVEDAALREVRVADVRFVLDSLRGLGRVADLNRIAGFGHGTGALTILDTMARDRRLDAGVVLNGDPLGTATLDRPVLL
ncbi:MAG: alpha/beta hydrolase, partial [Stackebrandtia sp.]